MRTGSSGLWAVAVVGVNFAWASVTPSRGDEPKRARRQVPHARREVSEAQRRYPQVHRGRGGRASADIERRWRFATRIVVACQGGKVSEVWGTFSEHLPVEKLTPVNLRKVPPGMTEKEVIDIHGDRHASVGIDGVETGQWGASSELVKVQGCLGPIATHRTMCLPP